MVETKVSSEIWNQEVDKFKNDYDFQSEISSLSYDAFFRFSEYASKQK